MRRHDLHALTLWVRLGAAFATLMLFSCVVHANFDVCNSGTKVRIQIAWVSRDVSWPGRSYEVSGWSIVEPGQCKRLAGGNVSEHVFWLHAEAEGVTLTADYANPAADALLRFCVTDGGFSDKVSSSVSDPHECPAGKRMAAFPITTRSADADLEVNFKPDDVAARAPQQRKQASEYLPSLFGAVFFDKTGMFYTNYLEKSAAAARSGALSRCRQGAAPDSCELRLEFADQCAVTIQGDKHPFYIATSKHNATAADAQAWAMERCKVRGNKTCELLSTLCSTLAAKKAHGEQQELELWGKVVDRFFK